MYNEKFKNTIYINVYLYMIQSIYYYLGYEDKVV